MLSLPSTGHIIIKQDSVSLEKDAEINTLMMYAKIVGARVPAKKDILKNASDLNADSRKHVPTDTQRKKITSVKRI